MGSEHLSFLGRAWLAPVGILMALGLVFLTWSYLRSRAPRGLRLVCLLLKLIGLTALALCLLDPQWTDQRAQPGQNQIAILADNSESMTIHDPGQKNSRGEQLRAMLRDGTPAWRDQLSEVFRVRRYLFDSRLKTADDFSELAFDGRASALGAAIKSLAELNHGQPLAGVLLFTDGNATDLKDGLPETRDLPPLFPILIGGGPQARDIAIQNVAVNQTAFEDAPVTIQASVEASGYEHRQIQASIIDRQGTLVERQTQAAPRDGEKMAFRFQIRPRSSGLSFYRLEVSAASETNQFDHPEQAAEATLANNTRWIPVDRGQDTFRVLYLAGKPSWEYKFMKRALDEDPQLQISSLIRVAKREPKFAFHSRAEAANPLFSGFERKDETTERYDQPVLIRLNVRDEEELRGGFPKTAEELYAYQAVIVDDMEAEFFTADQQILAQKFVSERGGGFLMLGGVDSFQAGKYQRTPMGDMLPVYLDSDATTKRTPPYRLNLTREGWLQPWARLRDNEREETSRLENMPAFEVVNPSRGIKPGASAIATVAGSDGANYPALVAQRFGNGRVAALAIGDLWRWGFRDAESHRDMDKAWRQMIRWLVSDVPNRVSVTAEPQPSDPNQAVRLQVRVRDPKFQPIDDAQVTLRVRRIGAGATNEPPVRITAELAPNEAGLYQAPFIPREAGGYQVEATATNNVGAEIGRARAGWATDLASEEFRSLQPNRALMETLARQTGGEVVEAKDLAAFVKKLPFRKMPVTETWSRPLWHQPYVFLFALLCFIGEWGLRRWKGLP
jgi:uncharacterized membrane protein